MDISNDFWKRLISIDYSSFFLILKYSLGYSIFDYLGFITFMVSENSKNFIKYPNFHAKVALLNYNQVLSHFEAIMVIMVSYCP